MITILWIVQFLNYSAEREAAKIGGKQQEMKAYLRQEGVVSVSVSLTSSLDSIVQFAEETAREARCGYQPGQFLEEVVQAFLHSIRSAVAAPNGEEAAIRSVRQAADVFLNSVHVSDQVIDAKQHLLAYSVYRRELNRLVWQAKACLLIDPESYTEGAKTALRDSLERAEAVLNGTYQVPFVRNREFHRPRPDENIQFATEYCSMAPSYGMTTYGLRPALAWYENEHILMSTYRTLHVGTTFSTYVSALAPDCSYAGKRTVEIDQGHIAYVQFPLSGMPQTIRQARLRLTNHHIDGKRLLLYLAPHLAEEGVTYADVANSEDGSSVPGTLLSGFHINFRDRPAYVDITEPITSKLAAGAASVTFALTNEPGAAACGFYTKEYSDESMHPVIDIRLQEVDEQKLEQKARFVLNQAKRMIDSAVIGQALGQYPEASVLGLLEAMSDARRIQDSGKADKIGHALVKVYNAMRTMRYTQVLRSALDPAADLFFDQESRTRLQETVSTSPVLKAEYGKLKELSDGMSLEDIRLYDLLLQERPEPEELNARFKLWSVSPVLSFTPPDGTESAELRFVLPSDNHEEHGRLGHVWIDDVQILPANATNLAIDNPGFELGEDGLPAGWKPCAVKGEPIMKWEDRPHYVHEGQRSLYICNPTAADEGSWAYGKELPMQGGVGHTIRFHAKIDGKLASGVHAVLTFKDKSGAVIGVYRGAHNKKSMLGNGDVKFSLLFQADALVYALTGDRSYADKAKARMLWMLNDFCQGVESWLVTNMRPDGIDAYGAVQGGRIAAVVALAYAMIRPAGVFTPEEHRTLLARVDYLLLDLMDLRDRTEMGEYAAHLHTSNWHTDMAAGAAMLALAMPELPHARQWFDNGRAILKGQLDYHVNEDGSWPESIRYLFAVIPRYAGFAKALRHMTGENWFHGTKLARMFDFAVSIQTPPYAYFDGRIATPNFGDHMLDDGRGYASLGLFIDEVGSTDTALASRMYNTWAKAGRPLAPYGHESSILDNFFIPAGLEKPEGAPLKLASEGFADMGLFLFRHRFGDPEEGFVSIVSNAAPIGHGHADQGSFILFAHQTPIVADPGVESYFDSTFAWYTSSNAHSTVQFSHHGQYVNTPRTSEMQAFQTSELLDYCRIRVANSEGEGTQTRHLFYVKDEISVLIVWDDIRGAREGTIFNLPVAAVHTDIEGSRALSKGHYDVDLETVFLLPEQAQLEQAWGRCKAMAPPVNGAHQLNYIRVKGNADASYLAVLHPHKEGTAGLQTERLKTNKSINAWKISLAESLRMVLLINPASEEAAVQLPAMEAAWMDMLEGTNHLASEGQVTITLAGGGSRIFRLA